MTDSFGTLFKASLSSFKAHFVTIAAGAVIFGGLMYGSQLLFQNQASSVGMGNPMMNMDYEQLEEIAESGDVDAMAEFMEQSGMAGMLDDSGMPTQQMEDMSMAFVRDLLPLLAAFMLVNILLSVIAGTYYLLIGTGANVSLTPKYLLPVLGLWVWMFIRSFAWIPFIGVIFAIVILPRLMLAPVILVKEGKGVFASVRESNERSRGYWGKIVGNILLAIICVWFVMAIVGVVSSMVSMQVYIGAIQLVNQLATAFLTIFAVRLAETVMANPLQTVVKK